MHEQYLLAALNLAWQGRGQCAPNPSVGAVAVHNQKIIAQAWHQGAGMLHAEQHLLQALPSGLADVTLYVTLEPCNHWGRTPPCVDAIIEYGIKRVVFAYADPNPIVMENHTPALLRAKGIEVLHYPLPEITRFYESYAYWTQTQKPWVTVKIAQSFDGKVAGKAGEQIHISNAKCDTFTHENRLHTDIILTTARTIENDDPQLNVRLSGVAQTKTLAVLDRKKTLQKNYQAFVKAKSVIIYCEDATSENPLQQATYQSIALDGDRLDLEAIIADLGKRGFHDVWVEAGPKLFHALHQARLVNRTYIYLCPAVLGANAIDAYEQSIFTDFQLTWQMKEDNVIASFDWLNKTEVM